jgi:hypothetical protein
MWHRSIGPSAEVSRILQQIKQVAVGENASLAERLNHRDGGAHLLP